MSVEGLWLLSALYRVEHALSPYPAGADIRELIVRAQAPQPVPPASRVRKVRAKPVVLPEGLGRALPPPPKARPLLNRLNGHKAKLRLVVDNPNPEPSRDPLSTRRAPPDPIGAQAAQASGARSLLLEIIRRAAFDWVLYRSSRRLDQKLLAEDAYTWIFLEEPGHPHWKIRQAEGKQLTSFICICEQLDVDADRLRGYIRKLSPNRVMSSGRPPENSRPGESTMDVHIHADVDTGGAYDFDSLLLPFDID